MMAVDVSSRIEERPVERAPPLGPTPVTFGPPGAQLFGLHHAPAAAVARGSGVVLCNPLGFEAMCTHCTYRHLAERLAAAGFHVLRFDHHGTGDSSGLGDEPERVRAWLDGVGFAIDELRESSGVRAVDLFGVRFGATLAALSAEERGDVRSLVLWAPCVTGRAYVRELRAFRMMNEKGAEEGAPTEGPEEIAGYSFERATLDEVSAIDLLAKPGRIADRALVLSRDDLPGAEKRLTSHFERSGVDALLRAEPGYAAMMRDPQETIVPLPALEAIVDWLRAAPDAGAARVPGKAARPSALTALGPESGRPVREESHHFGPGGRLFGILTEPLAEPARRARTAVVFLNTGANHRVGPSRMYVSLARDLAARGHLSFRVDLAGFGDGRAEEGAPENLLYSRDSIRDVKAAMTFLGSLRGVERVVLAGICSGAYLAFHTAIDDARVAGQILINPQTFEWTVDPHLKASTRESYKSTRYYLRALLQGGVWAQALRGDLHVRSVLGVLSDRLVARAGVELHELVARLRGRPTPTTDTERAFCAMSDRSVESLLVFSSSDGGLDMIEKHLGRDARKVRGRKNIHLSIVDGADHTFTMNRPRRELFALMTRFVDQLEHPPSDA